MLLRKNKLLRADALHIGFSISVLSVTFGLNARPSEKSGITYASHVHEIIFKNCVPCHQPGRAAPFSLLGYDEVKQRAKFILHVVEEGIMPPWPADPSYRRFLNEKILTSDEVKIIKEWVESGALPGDTASLNGILHAHLKQARKPDFVFSMPEEFRIDTSSVDKYARFRVSSDLTEDIDVSAFEFVPGNMKAVHHTEFLMKPRHEGDSSPSSDSLDFYVTEKYSDEQSKIFKGYEYVTGWLPGTEVESFPAGVAKRLPKDADFIFLIHYPPAPVVAKDSSVLYVYESSGEVERYMKSIGLHGAYDIVNGPLVIPADSIKTFHSVKTVSEDASAFAIMPHAHHLCRKMLAYAVIPGNDSIPLLRIKDWHFDWQYLYKFPKYIKLPQGTVIHFFATYDNTASNPENPYNPPRDIFSSFNANDEMMELFIFTVPYREGDEKMQVVYE